MGLFSKKDKAEEAGQDFKEKPLPPPPAYQATAPVDVADITSATSNLKLDVQPSLTSLPSKDECTAHLKFLASLAHLREEISETDGLYGIGDDLADEFLKTSPSTPRENIIVKLREKRWAVYVTRAVDRFQKWWQVCVPTAPIGTGENGTVSMDDILKDSILTPESLPYLRKSAMRWTSEMMPPLDVLMVLHSYMLNPRDILEDCIRQCKLPAWYTGMPWAQINACIDNTTFDYNVNSNAVSEFESKTGLPFDSLQEPPYKSITCYSCKKQIKGSYTEPILGQDLDEAFSLGRGFADRSMKLQCPSCGFTTTHDTLRLIKFRQDMERLLKYSTPMPGTILSLKGLAEKEVVVRSRGGEFHDLFFPNHLIRSELSTKLLEMTDKSSIEGKTFDDVRKVIQDAIISGSVLKKMAGQGMKNPFRSSMLLPGERIAIRRLTSRYWENSSPFALDLTGAVIRQGIFVDKMAKLDWIHSPALEATMTRLIKKYEIFFQIMATNAGHMAVPTLDVDLAWHTHQLSPPRYYAYSLSHMKDEFVDHNDKVDEVKLSDNFAWTSKQYQKITNGGIYSECTCWYCEAIRESTYSTFSATSKSTQKNALNLHDNPIVSSDPTENPHISAHNAVRAYSRASAIIAASQRHKLQADYERACKRARKAGRTPPSRNDYAYAYAWGYPMFVPVGYYPYGADPCISASGTGCGMYAYNPGCMSIMAGASGNCAAVRTFSILASSIATETNIFSRVHVVGLRQLEHALVPQAEERAEVVVVVVLAAAAVGEVEVVAVVVGVVEVAAHDSIITDDSGSLNDLGRGYSVHLGTRFSMLGTILYVLRDNPYVSAQMAISIARHNLNLCQRRRNSVDPVQFFTYVDPSARMMPIPLIPFEMQAAGRRV